KYREIVLSVGGDLLAKKQYRQKVIKRWRLKKMKRDYPINHGNYVDIQTNVVLRDVNVSNLAASKQEGKKKAIERWRLKKDRSKSLQTSPVISRDASMVRQHCTLEPIHAVERTGLYDSFAESSNAANLRKRVNETLNDMQRGRLNSKKSKKDHLKNGRHRLTAIPLTPLVLKNVSDCPHCFAKKFEYETYSLCCLDGDTGSVSSIN
ncbi:abscisic acid-responsive, partial [Striga asiatica]